MEVNACSAALMDGEYKGEALKSQHFPRRQNRIPSLDHMNSVGFDGCRTTAFNR